MIPIRVIPIVVKRGFMCVFLIFCKIIHVISPVIRPRIAPRDADSTRPIISIVNSVMCRVLLFFKIWSFCWIGGSRSRIARSIKCANSIGPELVPCILGMLFIA